MRFKPMAGLAAVAMVATALITTSCDKKGASAPLVPQLRASEILANVSLGTTASTYTPGTSMGPGAEDRPQVLGAATYIEGSSVAVRLSVPANTTELRVGVANREGFFRVPVSSTSFAAAAARAIKGEGLGFGDSRRSAQGLADVIVTLTPSVNIGSGSFTAVFVAQTATGATRAATHTLSRNTDAATSNNLQVSLNWIGDVDLDLHVETPDAVDIYWANRSASGGELDLDSNAGCSIDHVNNENITWGATAAPAGNYIVRVDLWSACSVTGAIPYVLTVRRCGQVETVFGSVDASAADNGGAYSGAIVSQFTHAACAGTSPRVAARPARPTPAARLSQR